MDPAAVPDSNTPSPIAKTRNPAATMSMPDRKYLRASRLVATTKATLSIAHKLAWRAGEATSVPASPKTAPTRRPPAAIRSRVCWGYWSWTKNVITIDAIIVAARNPIVPTTPVRIPLSQPRPRPRTIPTAAPPSIANKKSVHAIQ